MTLRTALERSLRGYRAGSAVRAALCLLRGRPRLPRAPGEVAEQPFDRELLSLCPLYRLSRKRFLARGMFAPRLASRQRALFDGSFLTDCIEYSPIASEIDWIVANTAGRLRDSMLAAVLPFVTNVFHEQNHRLVRWNRAILEQAGPDPASSANLAEAIVIALDYALGDVLGPRLSVFFKDLGITFSPGFEARVLPFNDARGHRRYLLSAVRALWLRLDGAPIDAIRSMASAWPCPAGTSHAVERALRLDPGFVEGTNRLWQARALGAPRRRRRTHDRWTARLEAEVAAFLAPFPLSVS